MTPRLERRRPNRSRVTPCVPGVTPCEHGRTPSRPGRRVNEHGARLCEDGRRLDEDGRRLCRHGRRLREHGRRLCEHGRRPCEHGRRLCEHGRRLYEEGRRPSEHGGTLRPERVAAGRSRGPLGTPRGKPAQLEIGGLRSAHGRACSSWAASRKSVASSPNLPTKCEPTGSPSAFQNSGTDMAGCPVTFARAV